MRPILAGLFLFLLSGVHAQSLHFVASDCVPYQNIAGSMFGRLTDPRIDVLRTKRDWDTYFSAQSGMFGGPAITTLIQPDFCREQVVAVNLGSDGTFGQSPTVEVIRPLDYETWEIVVDLHQIAQDQVGGKGMFSPYVAFRTPIGPNNFRFVFVGASGREVVELRSPMGCHRLPRDWWRH